MLASICGSPQQPKQKRERTPPDDRGTIKMKGSAELEVPNDEAHFVVRYRLRETPRTYEEEEVEEWVSDLLGRLVNARDVETTYRNTTEYTYDNKIRKTHHYYEGRVSFVVSEADANAAQRTLTSMDAERLSMYFRISETSRRESQQEAVSQATHQAIEKAEAALKVIGKTSYEVELVDTEAPSTVMPMYRMASAEAMDSGPVVSVGTQTVRSDVHVVVRF